MNKMSKLAILFSYDKLVVYIQPVFDGENVL